MALVDGVGHQLAVAFVAGYCFGEVGDEVVAQAIGVFQGVSLSGAEVDPVPGALLEDACFKGDVESCSLGGRYGFRHDATPPGVTCILVANHDVHSCTLVAIQADRRFFPLNALALAIAVLEARV